MAMKNGPLKDVLPIKNEDIPLQPTINTPEN